MNSETRIVRIDSQVATVHYEMDELIAEVTNVDFAWTQFALCTDGSWVEIADDRTLRDYPDVAWTADTRGAA